jgi:hypothetical protein
MKDNKRYYLHKKVRESGLEVKPKSKTIYIPHTIQFEIPECVETLRRVYNYAVQIVIV